MRAVIQNGYGGPEVLTIGDAPTPEPKPDEVLVEVHAAGLDRGTWHLMTGTPLAVRLATGLRHPRQPVPGIDLTGTVRQVGTEVSRFSIGDRVVGIGQGSFAEFAVAAEAKLTHAPAETAASDLAVLPVSGITAYQAVHTHGAVQSCQRVLVLGASGGVGHFAVQMAAALGAQVTGVCSTPNVDFVRSLGAAKVVDRTRGEAPTGQFDVVIDIAGNPSLRVLLDLLTPTGTAVIVGGEGGGRLLGGLDRQARAVALSPFIQKRLEPLVASENHTDLEAVLQLVSEGQVRPRVFRTVPMAQVATGMQMLIDGQVHGKIAVDVCSSDQ